MKISVIMVTYNVEESVEGSILSLVKQDYLNKEIILIDGASTDNTVKVVTKYKDYIDYFISEKDCGIYDAMNKGIQNASGDIISFLNAGDYYINNHVLTDVSKSFVSNADVFCGNIFLQIGNSWRNWKSNENLQLLLSQCDVASPACFYRNRVFDEYGGFDSSYRCSGDYEFLIRLYERGAAFNFIDNYTLLMTDGGVSSDPRKIAYKEDKRIWIQYGVSPVIAEIRCWKGAMRYTIVNFLRKIKLDRIIKEILGRPQLISSQELGIDLDCPWFMERI